MTEAKFRKEDILAEALPFIQEFEGKTFVIKYGGAVMEDETLKQMIAQDVTLLRKIGIDIVVVHGGGKEITALLNKLNIKTEFINGQRYTDESTRDVVQMVLGGLINKDIVRRINTYSGRATGLSGIDAGFIQVKKYLQSNLGFVGEVIKVDETFIINLLREGYLPVIAPLGVDKEGTVYNINADNAAGSIAAAINAAKLIYITDVEGVKSGDNLLSHLSKNKAAELVQNGIISGGMIPKVNSAITAIGAGVKKVHIIDGRVPHALLLEIFTPEGTGTEITAK